jgi:segregation and condensation protein A
MESVTYRLDQFEGPLDLLLTLIQKNKVNISDIPIALICDQYVATIAEAQRLDMDVAAEFLVMASELMLIKSKMLLPRNEETDEDPRAMLASAMLEYKRTKEASVSLTRMFGEFGSRMIKDTDEIQIDTSYVADHDAELLSRAMLKMLSEIRVSDEDAVKRFEPLIKKPPVSVAVVATRLIEVLSTGKPITLYNYFSTADSRSTMIAMFMAMLELLKAGAVLLEETEYSSDGVIRSDESVQISLNQDADPETVKRILKESANT